MKRLHVEKILKEVSGEENLEEAIIKLYKLSYIYNCCDSNEIVNTQVTKAIILVIEKHFNCTYIINDEVEQILYNIIKSYLKPRKKRNVNLINRMQNEKEDLIKNEVEKIESYIISQFSKKMIEEIFLNRLTLGINKNNTQYYKKAFKIEIDEEILPTLGFKKYINDKEKEFGYTECGIQNKIYYLEEFYGEYTLRSIFKKAIENNKTKKKAIEKLDKQLKVNKNILKHLLNKYEFKASKCKENLIIEDNLKHLESIERLSILKNNKSFEEGERKLITHCIIERNSSVVKLAKKLFKKKNGKLFCECCGFNFKDKYGELGEDYIEAHHENPLSENCGKVETKIEHFRMVCSDCHRMLHRRVPCLKVEELKEIINEQHKIKIMKKR